MTWSAKPIQTTNGLRWVVESNTGRRQHDGHLYPDEHLARYWADVLTAFHKAWNFTEETP